MHFNILTLNTALVFTLMIHRYLTPSNLERSTLIRKKGLAIGNILKHNSFALTDGLFIKLK